MPVRSTTGAANDFPAGQALASGVQNGGAVIHAGSNAAGVMTKNLSLADIADKFDDVTGSKVVTNDGTGAATTDRAGLQSVRGSGGGGTGTLGFTPEKDGTRSEIFIMRDVTTALNGAAYKAEMGPALNGNFNNGTVKDSIHGTIGDRKVGSDSDRAFDVLAVPSTQIVPGRTKGTGAGNANTFVNPADGSAAVAGEIFPSRSVPGELTYHFGGLGKATTDEYKAKDSYEDATDTSS